MASGARTREADLAARWLAGMWRGATLQSEGGEAYRVVFEGRRGGGAGPDFRNAVLVRADGVQVYGDIELHLRPAGWYAHGHANDPRYNGLALHVVLRRGASDPAETPLASGRTVPLVVLGELATASSVDAYGRWPCADLATPGNTSALTERLHAAGMARFHEHATQMAGALRTAKPSPRGWDSANRTLWLALAEALGYGRDRATLRGLGELLLANPSTSLEHLSLPGVERIRARGLLAWYARWQGASAGPWAAIEAAIQSGETRHAVQALLATLRVVEYGAVSPSRAAIVAVNVALPFGAALATIRGDTALASRAQAVYRAWPGLPSNQIVREMARTLGLARLPRGAVAQQGLQHLWQHACREKQCGRCPCATNQGK